MGLWCKLRSSIVPVTRTVHATCLPKTDSQSVCPGVLLIDMCLMCASLGFNVIVAVVPLERVKTLLGVEWRISQLVERYLIRLG